MLVFVTHVHTTNTPCLQASSLHIVLRSTIPAPESR
jgi:hypothetical protein